MLSRHVPGAIERGYVLLFVVVVASIARLARSVVCMPQAAPAAGTLQIGFS